MRHRVSPGLHILQNYRLLNSAIVRTLPAHAVRCAKWTQQKLPAIDLMGHRPGLCAIRTVTNIARNHHHSIEGSSDQTLRPTYAGCMSCKEVFPHYDDLLIEVPSITHDATMYERTTTARPPVDAWWPCYMTQLAASS